MRMARCIFSFVLVVLITMLAGTPAAAQSVQGIRPLNDEPICPRGGVLMLELGAQRQGPGWPGTVRVRFDASGDEVDGEVVWLTRHDRPDDPGWTSPVNELVLRPIQPTDDSSTGTGRPLLLIEIPQHAAGAMRLLSHEVRPVYVDRPTDPPVGGQLGYSNEPDRPNPVSPFEYWRWVLLARRLQLAPPEALGSPAEQLVAKYHADLWRLGVDRLEAIDPGAAEACVRLLTETCMDGERPIAAWVTDPAAIGSLLEILLDPTRRENEVARDAREWTDSRETMFFWVERDHGERVTLAIVNAGERERIATFRWWFADRAQSRDDEAIAVELSPQRVTRVVLDRPLARDEADPPSLLIESERFRRQFAVRPGVQPVRPPGLLFPPLQPQLTLAEARAFTALPIEPGLLTSATLRRQDGRWELFVECRRPGGPPANLSPESTHLDQIGDWSSMRGAEAVTVLFGPKEAPLAAVSIPEVGRPRVWTGGESTMEVHRNSKSDRWWCRLVIPDSWLGYPLEATAMIGLIRTHEGSQRAETSPIPATEWRFEPGRIEVDLRAWADLPGFGGR